MIIEQKMFYCQDKGKYVVSKNKELLTWLKNAIKKGYHSFTDIYDLQNLINNIAYWYEMKYPEREMEFYEGKSYFCFKNVKPLSKVMNIEQLMYRLPFKQAALMRCKYITKGGEVRDIHNYKGEIIDRKVIQHIKIGRKGFEYDPFSTSSKLPYFFLNVDENGKVEVDDDLKDYTNDDSITLEELLVLFKEKYSNDLDFIELEECIFDHDCDVELRRRILQLVALKLLYSNRTTPERGYERAKRFINEFNKKMCLNLTTEEMDEAFVNHIRDSFFTLSNVKKNQGKSIQKIKKFYKTTLKK